MLHLQPPERYVDCWLKCLLRLFSRIAKKSSNPLYFQLKKPLSTLSIPSGGGGPQQQGATEATALAPNRPSGTDGSAIDGFPKEQVDSVTGEGDNADDAMTKKGVVGGEGDASIALVGVRSEFPKYGEEKGVVGKERAGSNVGYR